ncbi:MAG TPA: VOC family protein [Candidatus Binatia bacterium]
MFAKIKHVAIVTDDCERLGAFYRAVFQLRGEVSEEGKRFRKSTRRAVAVTDGNIGLNFNLRKPGRPASLDHFGVEVEDVERVFQRLRDRYPGIETLSRPGGRAFAGLSTHDPAGNVFDLSQEGMANRTSVYNETGDGPQKRFIHHLNLRVVDPDAIARFYQDVYEFEPVPSRDGNTHLTDGAVTLIIAPWKLGDFLGTGIERPKLDHIGFKVESLEAVQRDVDGLSRREPSAGARVIADDAEGEARLKLLAQCGYGARHFADPDGTLIDIAE